MSQGEGALCRYNINGGSVVVGRMLNHTAPRRGGQYAGKAVCRCRSIIQCVQSVIQIKRI